MSHTPRRELAALDAIDPRCVITGGAIHNRAGRLRATLFPSSIWLGNWQPGLAVV